MGTSLTLGMERVKQAHSAQKLRPSSSTVVQQPAGKGVSDVQTTGLNLTEATVLPGQTDSVGQAWALPDLILRSELREGNLTVNCVIVACMEL